MRDHLDDLRATARDVMAVHLPADSETRSVLDLALWKSLDDLGLIGVAAPEAIGGSGGDLVDAATVLAEVAAAALPYAEAAFVAAPALAAAGIDLPTGPFTAARMDSGADDAASGILPSVPWAGQCDHLVLLGGPAGHPHLWIIDLRAAGVEIAAGRNLAGEPRDTVTLTDCAPIASGPLGPEDALLWSKCEALSRAVAAAGVAARIVDLTSSYIGERTQFGRPLERFQAVQHAVAVMAMRATAMRVAADAAVTAVVDDPAAADLLVAAAKAESAALSGPLVAAAHQAHGAIGFTREYELCAFTTRLWAWREEHGNERAWSAQLGALACGPGLWSLISG